jgi:hypothetical protein
MALTMAVIKNRLIATGAGLFFALAPALAQSRYGLNCYGDACVSVDEKAQSRMTNARTICYSGDSGIRYPKNNKPSADEMPSVLQDLVIERSLTALKPI